MLDERIMYDDKIAALIFKFSGKNLMDYTTNEIRSLHVFDDLEFDSIMLVDLLIALEETFDIEVTDDMSELLENMECVGTFIDYIRERILNNT